MNAKNIKIGDILTFMSYNKKVFPSYINEVEHFCRHKVDHKSKIQDKKVRSITITEDGLLFNCSDMSAPTIVHETEIIGVNLKTDEIRNNAIREFLKNKKKEKIKEIQKLLKNLQNLSFTPISFCKSKTCWEYIEAKVEESKES